MAAQGGSAARDQPAGCPIGSRRKLRSWCRSGSMQGYTFDEGGMPAIASCARHEHADDDERCGERGGDGQPAEQQHASGGGALKLRHSPQPLSRGWRERLPLWIKRPQTLSHRRCPAVGPMMIHLTPPGVGTRLLSRERRSAIPYAPDGGSPLPPGAGCVRVAAGR